ncbi:MAG: SxtJ family membrane protein [Isosphaeraceae bacterium]|nr:SxtJ family membrane protein [Isosphaeraceae bacterium]
MRWSDIPRDPTPKLLRQFAAIGALIFGFAGIRSLATGPPTAAGVVAAAVAVGFAVVGWARPKLLGPIFVGWSMLAFPIGFVVSQIILAAIFFGLFVPLGFAMRLSGRDPLALAADAPRRRPRVRRPDPKRYLKPY